MEKYNKQAVIDKLCAIVESPESSSGDIIKAAGLLFNLGEAPEAPQFEKAVIIDDI